jgi:hypothetical protein
MGGSHLAAREGGERQGRRGRLGKGNWAGWVGPRGNHLCMSQSHLPVADPTDHVVN